jgi:Double zinc ribbon
VIDIYVLIAIVVVLGALGAGLGLLAIKRLRAHRAKLLSDLATSPRQAADRAFNRIEMARREVAILGRQGADTSRARDQIAQAQAAFDNNQHSRAYELAQSAHESLVHARLTGTLPGGGPALFAPATTTSSRPTGAGAPAAPLGAPAPSPASSAGGSSPVESPRLAPNRAESHFQIHLLDADLEAARSSRSSPSMIATASALRSQAQAAFDREQYTDALKFALRGRRELGGKVESLAPSPGPAAVAVSGTSATPAADPFTAAERAASGSRCSQCGYPTRPDDGFCRGCGQPLVPTACPKCGTPRAATDTFCGKCGQRFS